MRANNARNDVKENYDALLWGENRLTAVSVIESRSLDSSFFLDDNVATIETTFATNTVINVPGAAVGADGDSRGHGLIVGATFSSAGF